MSRDVPVVGDDGRRKLLEREVAAPAGWALPSADSSQLCTSRGIIPCLLPWREGSVQCLQGVLGYLEGG